MANTNMVKVAKAKAAVIAYLNENGGPVNGVNLRETLRTGLSTKQFSQLLRRLVTAGLVGVAEKGSGRRAASYIAAKTARTAAPLKEKPLPPTKARDTQRNVKLRINKDGSITVVVDGFNVTISAE